MLIMLSSREKLLRSGSLSIAKKLAYCTPSSGCLKS